MDFIDPFQQDVIDALLAKIELLDQRILELEEYIIEYRETCDHLENRLDSGD